MATFHETDPFSDGGKPSRRTRMSPPPTPQLSLEINEIELATKPENYPQDKWDRMHESARRGIVKGMKSLEEGAAMANAEARKALEPKNPKHSTFTTQYATDWAKRLGWKIIDRERYDARTKRHNDLQLRMDLMAEDPKTPGMIMIQAAGQGERAHHYREFVERGGEAKARHRFLRILYVEFVRGNTTPVKQEWWVE